MPDATPVSPIVNAMTVDVEDYFQVSAFDSVVSRESWATRESRVVANTERLLALFHDAGVVGTFFVLGWVAERFPELVRRIASGGHEIASHGYGHRLVYDQSPEQFREDIRRSKGLLESLSGAPVNGYRAPSYSITLRSLWALDALIDEGYTYDASIFPIHHDRYGIPGSPRHAYVIDRAGRQILEAPGSTIQWSRVNLPVGGGGYFRILPYRWTRWGIARLNRVEQRPAIFYIHPWEIDPDQPRMPAQGLSRFRHYRNLAATEPRLRTLVAQFRFGTLAGMLRQATLSPAAAFPAATAVPAAR